MCQQCGLVFLVNRSPHGTVIFRCFFLNNYLFILIRTYGHILLIMPVPPLITHSIDLPSQLNTFKQDDNLAPDGPITFPK